MAATMRNQKSSVGVVNATNWEEILRQNYMKLSRIRPLYIVNYLYQQRVLNEADREDVASCQTSHRQATLLIDMLATKGFANFVIFLGILEDEYPEIFEEITEKPAVRKPGYVPKDHRRTQVYDILPRVLDQLSLEITNSKTQQESFKKLQQSIQVLKDEKIELEVDLERYRMELKDHPQLKRDLKILFDQNEDYKSQNLKLSRRCLAYVDERENADRKYAELKSANEQLRKDLEEIKFQRDRATRKTLKLEKFCNDLQRETSIDSTRVALESESLTPRARQYLEAEIDMLRQSESEKSDKNEELAMNLWEATENLERLQKDFDKALNDKKKCTEAMKNAEENLEHLQQRCNETYLQVDQLRSEKDRAIEEQHRYLEMYQRLSAERDRLSIQCRTLQTKYDNTKKQLDKLKQEMRSSLKSSSGSGDAGNLNYSINQWISCLEDPQLMCSGSSSSGVSDGIYSPDLHGKTPGHLTSVEAVMRPFMRDRSDTVSPEAGDVQPPLSPEDSGQLHRYLINKFRRLALKPRNQRVRERDVLDKYDDVLPSENLSSTGFTVTQQKDTDGDQSPGIDAPSHPAFTGNKFFVRCNQDSFPASSTPVSPDELMYQAGDILQVTDNKNDCWIAQRVNPNTGQPCPVGEKRQQGIIRLLPNKSSERPKLPAGSRSIERHGAIKRGKSVEKDPFTLVSMEKASEIARPVLLVGLDCMDRVISSLVSTYKGKYKSCYNDSAETLQEKLGPVMQHKGCHLVVPPWSLKTCYHSKVSPICVVLDTDDSEDTQRHVAAIFESTGQGIEADNHQLVEEIRSVAVTYGTVTVSKSAVSRKEDLLEKITQKIEQLQKGVVWRPQQDKKCAVDTA